MGVSALEKFFFTQHLSLMLKSGVSIVEALESLKEEIKSKTFKKKINEILEDILAGKSLSESLKKHPRIFDEFFCSVVKIGEKSGKLDSNLEFLAQKINQENRLKTKLRNAMIYPLILILAATMVVLLAVFFLLPKIIPFFSVVKIQLPLPTRILISLPSFFKHYGLLILAFFFLLFLLIRILWSLRFTRYYFEKFLFSLPFLGNFLKNLNLAHFARSFLVLFKGGLPIQEIFRLSTLTLQSEVYRKIMIFLISEVEKGEKIGELLKRHKKYFSPFFCQIVLSGEKTGNLENSFLYLTEFYNEKVLSDLKNFSQLVEPVLIIFVGILVGFIAFSIITPVYKFLSQFHFK
jgi:type II secretory pathway component PulF